MVTYTLADGYDRTKNPARAHYTHMTAEDAKLLRAGDHVLFLGNNGKVYRAKVNGAVKTWKRDTTRVEVPLKYGLYEYFTARATEDGTMTLLLIPADQGDGFDEYEKAVHARNSGTYYNSEGELITAD